MRKQPKPLAPKTMLNTCIVTGDRLRYDGPQVTVPDSDRIVYPRHANPEDLTPHSLYATGYRVSLPSRLHTRETEGPLGGHSYAGPLIRYLSAGQPRRAQRYASERLSNQEYALRYWWSPAWAERTLRAHFAADAVDIVLSVRRDHADWDTAMLGSNRALGDVKAQMKLMADLCRNLIRQETSEQAA